jgi:hypothetical protein
MFNFDKSMIEVPCPSCKFPNAVMVREVRFGLTVPCRGCKGNIQLVPMDGGLSKVKRSIENVIADFPKKININFKI